MAEKRRGVVDTHMHVPDLFLPSKLSPENARRTILEEMDEAGVEKALIYALEIPYTVMERVTLDQVYKGLEEAISYGRFNLPPSLSKIVEGPEEVLEEHSRMLRIAHTPSERVIDICRGTDRLFPVGSIDLESPGAVERLGRLLSMGVVAVKIYPTLSMLGRRELEVLDTVASLLEAAGSALIIHTGCDPGVWELPNFCEYGRPSRFEEVIRKHRDLPIVLSHMGAYSALAPGIYLHEALDLARRYSNVYLDTAAVEPHLIALAVRRVGAGKVMFGSDYPAVAWSTLPDLVARIAGLDIPEGEKERILYWNAVRVFEL